MTGDIAAYATWMQGRGLSATTVAERTRFARNRLAEWGTLDQPPQVVAAWLAQWSGWTRCTYQAHLRSLYTWLVASGQLAADPMSDIRRPRSPRPRPRPLSTDEARRALTAATGDLRAHLLLGFYAGLRAHEIAKIRGEDVTASSLTVLGKGDQLAVVPTHPDLWEVAQGYPRVGWWFPSPRRPGQPIRAEVVTRRVRQHFAALGITGATHRTRHSFGTTLARSGTPVRVVQDLLRHASLATTQMYLDVAEEERRLAIDGLRLTA